MIHSTHTALALTESLWQEDVSSGINSCFIARLWLCPSCMWHNMTWEVESLQPVHRLPEPIVLNLVWFLSWSIWSKNSWTYIAYESWTKTRWTKGSGIRCTTQWSAMWSNEVVRSIWFNSSMVVHDIITCPLVWGCRRGSYLFSCHELQWLINSRFCPEFCFILNTSWPLIDPDTHPPSIG